MNKAFPVNNYKGFEFPEEAEESDHCQMPSFEIECKDLEECVEEIIDYTKVY